MAINDRIVVRSISGDLRQGGTRITGIVDGDTDAVVFGDNVRLLGRSFANYADISQTEIFNGHILETPSFDFDTFSSQATIMIGTANFLMTGRLQAVGYTEQASPANDHQIAPTMRISSIFQHTVNAHCNFIYNATTMPDGIINETDYDTSDTAVDLLNVRGGNNFWGALQTQLSGGEEGGIQFFRPHFTRKNKFVYQAAPHFRSPALTTKGTITKENLRGRPRVSIRNAKASDRVGQVELVAVDADETVYTGVYPAQPAEGNIIKKTGIWTDGQSRVDTLAQNLFEWLTRPYTLSIEVDPGLILFGDDGQGLDLGEMVTVTYDGPTEDTATGAGVSVNFNAQNFFIYRYNITYDPRTRQGKGILELEADN